MQLMKLGTGSTMLVELHPEAKLDLSESALYYELREPGLGHRFVNEIEQGIHLISSHPEIGQQISSHLRYLVMDDFPFNLIYNIKSDRIWILAVAHQRRRPWYWLERK